jgi:hypothetical protein
VDYLRALVDRGARARFEMDDWDAFEEKGQ